MSQNAFRATVLALSLALAASTTAAWAQQTAPPGGKFQKVSALVALSPIFFPGWARSTWTPKRFRPGRSGLTTVTESS